jgi:hypothetical protein
MSRICRNRRQGNNETTLAARPLVQCCEKGRKICINEEFDNTYIVKRASSLQRTQRVRGLSAQLGLLGVDPEVALAIRSHFNGGN